MFDLLVSDLLLLCHVWKTHMNHREDEEYVVRNGK